MDINFILFSSREFAALHSEQFTVISADNKCKLPLGLPCVNRLNSLCHKFFLQGEGPNYTDHDHRSGYLVNPEGYQILEFTKEESHVELGEDSITQESGNSYDSDIMSDDETQAEKGDSPEFDKDDSDQSFAPVSVQKDKSISTLMSFIEVEPVKDALVESDKDYSDQNLSEVGTNAPVSVEKEKSISSTLMSFNLVEVHDEFMPEIQQIDGNLDSSSSEEEFDIDFANPVVRPRLQARQICSDEEDTDDQSSSEAETQRSSDKEDNNDQSFETDDLSTSQRQVNIGNLTKAETVLDSNGREHIKIPNTGETYVFYKSHRAKPSSISRHVDDLLTIDQRRKFKHNLLLLCDDGADWAGRSVQTIYWLGWLWRKLNLDMLIMARPAPGDSKWNPIER